MEYPKLPSPESMLWFPRILIATAIGMLAIACWGVSKQMERGGPIATTGTVINFEHLATNRYASPASAEMTDHRLAVFCPIVRFNLRDGREADVKAATCSSPPDYQIGERVPVEYHPDRPEMAAVGGFYTRHLLAVVFFVMGVPCLLLGLLVRRNMLRSLRAGLRHP